MIRAAAPGINADWVLRTIAGNRLVWHIQTLEGVERGFGAHNELESLVEANTGELLSQSALSSADIGTGTGPHAGTVGVVTSIDALCRNQKNSARKPTRYRMRRSQLSEYW